MKIFSSILVSALLASSTFGNTEKIKEVEITESNIAELVTALERYHSAYSSYPPLDKNQILSALGGKGDAANPKGLPFWKPAEEKKFLWMTSSHGTLNKKGKLIDGWSNPFVWKVSEDEQKLILVSKGENGILDEEEQHSDDLYFTVVEHQRM